MMHSDQIHIDADDRTDRQSLPLLGAPSRRLRLAQNHHHSCCLLQRAVWLQDRATARINQRCFRVYDLQVMSLTIAEGY